MPERPRPREGDERPLLAALTRKIGRVPARAAGWARRLYSHPLNRRQPLRALLRLARWYGLQRRRGSRVLAFWGDREIECWADSQSAMWLILNEIMDWDEFHFAARYLRPGDTVLDVGANIGVYSLWTSRFVGPGGRVVAFEPDPLNHERCRRQMERNRLDLVRVERLALSDAPGAVRFSQGGDMLNHVVVGPAGTAGTIEVEASTLDRYCAEHAIDRVAFAKIDVEGLEETVLRGSARLLERRALEVIQLEFNEQAGSRRMDVGDTVSLLADFGYGLYRYDPASAALAPAHDVAALDHVNLLAIADRERVDRRLAGGAGAPA